MGIGEEGADTVKAAQGDQCPVEQVPQPVVDYNGGDRGQGTKALTGLSPRVETKTYSPIGPRFIGHPY